jgi:hypothetical protein
VATDYSERIRPSVQGLPASTDKPRIIWAGFGSSRPVARMDEPRMDERCLPIWKLTTKVDHNGTRQSRSETD